MRSLVALLFTLFVLASAFTPARGLAEGGAMLTRPAPGMSPFAKRVALPPASEIAPEIAPEAIPEPPRDAIPPLPSYSALTAKSVELQFLRSSFSVLAQRESNPVLDGVMQTLIGGLMIGIGAGVEGLHQPTRNYYYILGASQLARAGLSFGIRPDSRGAFTAFDAMPESTAELADRKIAFGAAQLNKLARQHRARRLIGNSISIAAGIAPLPFLFRDGLGIYSGWQILVIATATIDIVSGIVGLAIASPAEKRERAYQELREKRGVANLRLAPLSLPGGGGIQLGLNYF